MMGLSTLIQRRVIRPRSMYRSVVMEGETHYRFFLRFAFRLFFFLLFPNRAPNMFSLSWAWILPPLVTRTRALTH